MENSGNFERKMRSVLAKIGAASVLFLLCVLFMQFVWRVTSQPASAALSAEKVNLALRKTADAMLKLAGDSTSRVPPVQQLDEKTWKVQLGGALNYDSLPQFIHRAFQVHDIPGNYDVAVYDCVRSELLLGYNFLDYQQNNAAPCGGRDMAAGCYQVQVTFVDGAENSRHFPLIGWLLSGLVVAFLYYWWQIKPAKTPLPSTPDTTSPGIPFGASTLELANQVLVCGNVRHELTYRETKLLHLFVQNSDQLLERSFILENVWADEGILVGRSVDVFVSRLRKLLKEDPSVRIVAVHGVGYRLETGVQG